MIKYCTLCYMIFVVIIYILLINTLNIRNEFLGKQINADIGKLPDKILLYKEQDGTIYKNFDDDLVKILKNANDGDEITIPRHGIYTISVNENNKTRIITGIPS